MSGQLNALDALSLRKESPVLVKYDAGWAESFSECYDQENKLTPLRESNPDSPIIQSVA
jgi:hypothetical protein